MGTYYCQRCDNHGDSKDGASVEDPTNELEMIHESCLTEDELADIQYLEEVEGSALRDKQNNTPEYQAWKTKREQELL